MGAGPEQSRLLRAKEKAARFMVKTSPDRPAVWPIGEYREGQPLEHYVVYFAGHGSPQAAGMEKMLREFAEVDLMYDSFAAALGIDLRTLTNEELKLTLYAQPAITAYNIASYLTHEALHPEELKHKPEVVSGQSLGVHSAGWYAGVFGERHSKEAVHIALEIATGRGEIFQKLYENPDSGHMLIRAGDKRHQPTTQDISALGVLRKESTPRKQEVSLGIDISDSRIIVGGIKKDLEEAREAAKKRFPDANLHFYEVPTSCVAFHTSLMKPIEHELRAFFERYKPFMNAPEIPILSNTHEEPKLITTVDEYIEEMVRLAVYPVYGRAMEKKLREMGIDEGLEFGERGIIANSMDTGFFTITPRKVALGGGILSAAVAGAILVPEVKEVITGYRLERKSNEQE